VQLTPLSTHRAPRKKNKKKGTIFFGHGVYQNYIRWVSQNTTLTHPPDIILIFDIVIAHNGDEPLKDPSVQC